MESPELWNAMGFPEQQQWKSVLVNRGGKMYSVHVPPDSWLLDHGFERDATGLHWSDDADMLLSEACRPWIFHLSNYLCRSMKLVAASPLNFAFVIYGVCFFRLLFP